MIALTLAATGSLEQLRLQDLPEPALVAPDDVRVRIHAAALNHLDLFVVGGLPGRGPTFPHIVGADGAGVIEAVGPAVQGLAVGDRVMINPGIACGSCTWCAAGDEPLCPSFQMLGEHRAGTLAALVVVPARNLAPVPPAMSWEQAAGFTLATLTAWRMLTTRARVQPGETVLIWGIGGGVAQAALRIARLQGATVIVTSSSEAKLAWARTQGASEALNHATTDVAATIRTMTGRRGVEVVVDSVGERTWDSITALSRTGRTAGDLRCHHRADGRYRPAQTVLVPVESAGLDHGHAAEFRQVVELAGQGKLWPEVDAVFPLARAVEAYRRLEAGTQMGKVVIQVGT